MKKILSISVVALLVLVMFGPSVLAYAPPPPPPPPVDPPVPPVPTATYIGFDVSSKTIVAIDALDVSPIPGTDASYYFDSGEVLTIRQAMVVDAGKVLLVSSETPLNAHYNSITDRQTIKADVGDYCKINVLVVQSWGGISTQLWQENSLPEGMVAVYNCK